MTSALRSFGSGGPRQFEPLYVFGIDLVERAEVRLGVVMAISEPLGAVAPSIEQLIRRYDASGFLCGPDPGRQPGRGCDDEPAREFFRFHRNVGCPPSYQMLRIW